ncbi:MAG: hypothetical protein K8F52_04770 [Candidatus Scalindua rubra]|nr:hypothetical protein [Candidatus Scalindua rubra]
MSYTVLILPLIIILNVATVNAMWVKLSDEELTKQSDVIITAELIGEVPIMINHDKIVIGVLKVEDVLKGDRDQTALLLALPSSKGVYMSEDIFYKKGQKGLWFLRERKAKGEEGIYLADHPQRFLSAEHAADKIRAIKKSIKNN